MADLSHLRIPIFTGINDQPRTPTSSLAGNGSHVIKTINDVIDNFSPPAEGWTYGKIFYLDTVGGSNTNDGQTETTPFKTLGALINLLQTKTITGLVYIYIKGTLTGLLDFSGVWAGTNDVWIGSESQIRFVRWAGDSPRWRYEGSGLLLKTNPLTTISIRFFDGDFVATDGAITLINEPNFIDFNAGCIFDTGEDNFDSVLHFEACSRVRLLDYMEVPNIKNTGANVWAAIVVNDRSTLWMEGMIFQNHDFCIGVYGESFLTNSFYDCDFGESTNTFDVYDNSRVYIKNPEQALRTLTYVGDGGRINETHIQTFFFPSLADGATYTIYRAMNDQRLQYVRVDGNLSGATFQVKVYGSNQGSPLDEMVREIYFDGAINTKMGEGDTVEIVVTGNPTNVLLQLELMDF